MAALDLTVAQLTTLLSDSLPEARLMALHELSADQPAAALETVKLLLDLEGNGPLAPALAQARVQLAKALGFKAAGMVADRPALAFRAPESRYRFLKLLRAEGGQRTYLAIHTALRLPVEVCVLEPSPDGPDGALEFLGAARRLALAASLPGSRVIDAGTFAGWTHVVFEVKQPEPVARPEPVPAVPSTRVLVIDDDLTVLMIASKFLTDAGFQLRQAKLPAEALQHLGAGTFDVVLTDLNFPGDLCGADVVAALKKATPATPIVAMSTSEELDIWTDVLREGVAGITGKPLDPTELVAMIRRAASGSRPAILFVDECNLTRRVFRQYFENRGFDVSEARGLESAKAQLAARTPSIVVTEFKLADGHGLDVAGHVLAHHSGVKTVIHAADPTAGDIIRALRLRVGDVVTKAGSPRYLLRTIEGMLCQAPRSSISTGTRSP